MPLLDAIDAELLAAQARVDTLREIRALAAQLSDAPPHVQGGALEDADTSPGSVVAVAGLAPTATPVGVLQRAAASTPARTARPSRTTEAVAACGRNGGDAPESSGTPVAPLSVNGAGRAPAAHMRGDWAVLDALRKHGHATPNQLIERTRLSRSTVLKQLATMRDERVVTVVERRPNERGPATSVYGITGLADAEVAEKAGLCGQPQGHVSRLIVQLRRDLLDTLREQPNGLSEVDAAAILGAEREHVALALGEFLEQDAVTLRGDGTYVIGGGS